MWSVDERQGMTGTLCCSIALYNDCPERLKPKDD